jgi:hypothetical protein
MQDSGPPSRVSWLVVFIFLGIGAWWFKHIPTVGKGGVLLAVGATLMPLFWERVGVFGKMFWILMLFVLFAVEYRAINKDREEATAQFQEIIAGFTVSMQQNQAHFNATVEEANRLLQLSRKTLEYITGGNAYCYIAPVPTTNINWQMLVGNSGNVTLPSCSIHLQELPNTLDRSDDSWRRFAEGFSAAPMQFPNVPPRNQGAHFAPYSIQAGPNRKYQAIINTPTRSFLEDIIFAPDGKTAKCELRTFFGSAVLKKGCDTLRP